MVAGLTLEQLVFIDLFITSILFLMAGILSVMIAVNRGEIRDLEKETLLHFETILQTLEEADIIEVDREEQEFKVKE